MDSIKKTAPDSGKSSPTSPRITVLRDDPLFGTFTYEPASDTFAYEAFARALLDVLENNAPPLSIGLFGPWGIGKSTIVNILFSKIRASAGSNLFPIYFNAWKYSGDSFRRQFLLEVASAVYGGREHKQVKRLERLNYTDVLKEKPDGGWLDELKELLTGNVIRTRRSGLIRIICGLFLVVIGSVLSLLSSSAYPLLTAALAFVIVFFLKLKFEEVFVVEDNRVFDPKLIFPEQFEQEFRTLVDPDLLKGKRAVIVIDDIDRCDPSTIKDILISTKNFVGHTNAHFLIPCDDLNVINVFEDAAHKSGYRDEMLRKYFNVGLRIPPISNRDLIDFANRMARDTKLPEDIVQLAVIADYRDARRIKNFANNFLLKLNIAKARSVSGYLPELTPDRELQLAKLVIIEDCAPPIFARLVQNPGLLQVLEASALSSVDVGQLQENQLENWQVEYPGLKQALIGARYVAISDLELLLSLKTDNLELSVPSGGQFRTALLQGMQDSLNSLLPEIAGRASQQALAYLIEDSLSRATGPLLANCIASTLQLPLRSFFADNDTRRVVRQISEALLREDQRIWFQSAPQVMDIVELLDSQMAKKIFGKYVSELMSYQEQPNRLTETVGSVYPRIDNQASFVNALNEKFMPWSTSEAGLVAISTLLQMKMNAGGNPFPSAYIVKSILDSFNPSSGDTKSNELRKDIVFASWDPLYGSRLSSIFWAVVQGASSRGAFDPPLRFTIKALCEKPEILGYPEGDLIAAQLASLLTKATSDEDRDLVRDLMITIAAAGLPGGKSTALSNLSSYWQNDSDRRIRGDVVLAQSLAADDVLLQILASQTNAVTKELQAPGDRTRERLQLISEFDKLVPGFLEGQLVAALSVTSESAYNFWEDIISSHRDRLSPQACSDLISKALALVSTTGEFNQRKPTLLKLAAGLFSTQSTAELTALIRRVFELLWHPDDTIRNSAAENLPIIKATANQGDFRIYLNAGIHEHLNQVGMSTLRAYQPVIDVLIANKDLWNESSARAITQLAVTLSSDDNLKTQAISLLESVSEFDEADVPDVVHVLKNIESAQTGLSDRARNLLQRIGVNPAEETPRDL